MQANPLSAQIDLHQIGAGFLGHYYFTHTYDGTNVKSQINGEVPQVGPVDDEWALVPTQVEHKVLGTWTPGIPYNAAPGLYTIIAALPANGAAAPSVTYHIDHGQKNGEPILASSTCTASQAGTGIRWIYLGTWNLAPGADVWLDNMVPGTDGTQDIAFSSLVFEPTTAGHSEPCGAAATVQG
jgi:hypothetical protein